MSLRIVCILYFFFKFYEILFENHILYKKVISIKIIIIIIIYYYYYEFYPLYGSLLTLKSDKDSKYTFDINYDSFTIHKTKFF